MAWDRIVASTMHTIHTYVHIVQVSRALQLWFPLLSHSNFSLATIAAHLFGFIRFPGAFYSSVG